MGKQSLKIGIYAKNGRHWDDDWWWLVQMIVDNANPKEGHQWLSQVIVGHGGLH